MVDTRSRDPVITSDWLQVRDNSSSTWELFSGNLVPMVDTLLASSPGTNIHFIVITDEWTLNGMDKLCYRKKSLLLSKIHAEKTS